MEGETIDVLNDFSGLNSKWVQGTVTVGALLPTVLFCYQTDLPSSIDSLLWFVRK